MRIGIMGVHYGHIGGMLQSARAATNGELVGIVEADDALYGHHTAKSAIPRFDSLEEMIAEARPELILEGLIHDRKAALVKLPLKFLNLINTYVQKPFIIKAPNATADKSNGSVGF